MQGCYNGCACNYILPEDKDIIFDDWDMHEDVHADNVVEGIAPRGDASSPPSLKHLTCTAMLPVVEGYVSRMLRECVRESCPLGDIFPIRAERQHWHWHYAQWLDMFNGLVEDHGFPPTIVKRLLPKVAYQQVRTKFLLTRLKDYDTSESQSMALV